MSYLGDTIKQTCICTCGVVIVYLPVIILANKEQSLSSVRVTEHSANLLHSLWQAHNAQALGVTLFNVIAIESPNLLTWRPEKQCHM